MLKIIVLVCLLALAANAASLRHSTNQLEIEEFKYTNCKPGSDYTLDNFTISPTVPHPGDDCHFTVEFDSPTEITSTVNVHMVVKFFGMKVAERVKNVCQYAKRLGLPPCPIPAGKHLIDSQKVLPSYAPAGGYTAEVKIMDGSSEVLCTDAKFNVQAK
eukprot:TRINITY_DN1552_c1_g1_i1.p1 TRINITY_DN1552_c1_g1~~TRINITY_DN1552_c1_g1_i1.p1  ORF type:complete len:159 (-),score=43.45 TRINITY_DN1552_c1_g1_i1:442-918(-)